MYSHSIPAFALFPFSLSHLFRSQKGFFNAMFHLWRTFRGTEYQMGDEQLSVTQQDELTVYRGWKGSWRCCFLGWSGSGSDSISASTSCICGKNNKQELRRRSSQDLSRRQEEGGLQAHYTPGGDSTVDDPASTATRRLFLYIRQVISNSPLRADFDS